MKSISLSFFLPAYNEEATIAEAVNEAVTVVNALPQIERSEIIVVNDGSTDGTKEEVERLIENHTNVRLVNHPTNQGYGAALRTGFETARMEYVFFTDADLQFDMGELKKLLVHVPKYDAVIGYRARRRDPPMRLLNARVWNALNRILFGLKVTDIDCAFKLFKRKPVQELHLQSLGAMISAELLIRLSRNAVPIKEIPVTHLPRTKGSATGARLSVIIRALSEMMRLYRSDLGLATQKELLRFGSVGIINTLLDISAYVVLTRGTLFFAAHLNEAKFLSFLVGTVSSLLLNRSWTFGLKTRPTFAEVARFYGTASFSILINVAMMNILLKIGIYDLVALLITTAITFVANFTLSKFWVFRKTERQAPELAYQ